MKPAARSAVMSAMLGSTKWLNDEAPKRRTGRKTNDKQTVCSVSEKQMDGVGGGGPSARNSLGSLLGAAYLALSFSRSLGQLLGLVLARLHSHTELASAVLFLPGRVLHLVEIMKFQQWAFVCVCVSTASGVCVYDKDIYFLNDLWLCNSLTFSMRIKIKNNWKFY